MTTATEYAIDTNLGIQTSVRKYGCLQSKYYQYTDPTQPFPFCIDPATAQMIDDRGAALLGLKECTAYNNKGEGYQVHEITSDFRVVFLGLPKRNFVINKETKAIVPISKGMKLSSKTFVTVVRLPLLLLVENGEDGELISNAETGVPQVMTLRLSSWKSILVSGNEKFPQIKSLTAANEAVVQRFKGKVGSSLLHLVSFNLTIEPSTFTAKEGGETSKGILFNLKDGAKPLPPLFQSDSHAVALTDEVQKLLSDPFGVMSPKTGSESSYKGAICLEDEF